MVSSESQHSRIRSVLQEYYIVMFVAIGICMYFLDWFYAAGCAIFGIGVYSVWIAVLTRRLVASEERLRFSESLSQRLPYYSTWVLVVMSFVFGVMFLMCGFALYTDRSEWGPGVLGLVVFGGMTVMTVFMTSMKLRSRRP